jgi:hypothetical protein
MNEQISIKRIGWLLGVHLLLGLAGASAAFLYPGFHWLLPVEICYLSLIVSEALLLGTWIGFSLQHWYIRTLGGLAGAFWICTLSVAPFPEKSVQVLLEVSGMILPIPFVVALVAMGFRTWLIRVRRADQWPQLSAGKDWQFTLSSLIGFMLVVSVLLALGRVLHSFKRDDTPVFVGVLCLIAVIAVGLLVWACLGLGRPAVRVPVATAGMVAIGLLVPYYTRNTYLWSFLIWSGLMLAISVVVIGTLLVMRSCGFRLVAIGHPQPTSDLHPAPPAEARP